MAITLTIENAFAYVSTNLGNQRLNVNGLEPGNTCANKVLQRMLASPFIWRFNRANLAIALVPAGWVQILTQQFISAAGVQSIKYTFNGSQVLAVGSTVTLQAIPGATALNGTQQTVTASAAGTFTIQTGSGSVNSAATNTTGAAGPNIAGATGQTDYTAVLEDLGRIETQWLTDTSGTIYELNGVQSVARNSTAKRPTQMGPVYDDNAGDITFRCNAVPDQVYTAYFDYQRKAPLITGPGFTFSPVPDEFGYIYNTLLLAECALLVNDARFNVWEQQGVAALLATQDGLDAQAKDIFYNQMINAGRTNMRGQMATQSGAQGRQTY